MISKCTDKHIIKIAGPGGGKTYSMIQDIKDRLNDLEPYRNLVVITYTNSATEEIRSRLSKEISIPDNVFIGTIHSFLIKFIVNPYSGIILDEMPNDRIYTDYDLDSIKKLKGMEKNIVKKRITDKLKKKGLISFDEIINISKNVVKDKDNGQIVREKISKRIKYLFIDEYQDVCNSSFEIFEEIRKAKYTHIYCVGDPEQYIDNYRNKIKKYQNIPFLKTLNKPTQYRVIKQEDNYRSDKAIVSFINNFNCNLNQLSKNDIDNYPVLFIENSGIEDIINESKEIEFSIYKDKEVSKFYIADENKLVNKLKAHIDIENASDELDVSNGVSICSEYIKKISRLDSKVFMEKHNINIIELRILSMKIFKFLTINKDINIIKKFIDESTIINISKDINFKSVTDETINKIIAKQKKDKHTTCTTIHKSKGLEADMVLVVAKNNKELSKWLEIEKEKRYEDISHDVCRRGFVAFSRARELLVISCEEGINHDNKTILQNLNVIEKDIFMSTYLEKA
ncbi:UvrD-helicase domain-containing protein [Romboutsia sedimentorum]|uniref:UvrD-helicase domain-containing protein n=1 Tax=Romboutsia sedimentorum TaxID=1368474 RepID=UPI0024DE2798|nr:UvrD-helicase domain-containing protein [Romboutsia sedimentorum]MDK2586033.1 UvrD-helicase domain-containing protein [Romboutsia sedimentorum]